MRRHHVTMCLVSIPHCDSSLPRLIEFTTTCRTMARSSELTACARQRHQHVLGRRHPPSRSWSFPAPYATVTSTHLLPRAGPPAPSVFREDVACADLGGRGRGTRQQVCALELLDVGVREALGLLPCRLVGLRVVKVRQPARVGETDFPGHGGGCGGGGLSVDALMEVRACWYDGGHVIGGLCWAWFVKHQSSMRRTEHAVGIGVREARKDTTSMMTKTMMLVTKRDRHST